MENFVKAQRVQATERGGRHLRFTVDTKRHGQWAVRRGLFAKPLEDRRAGGCETRLRGCRVRHRDTNVREPGFSGGDPVVVGVLVLNTSTVSNGTCARD